MASVKVILLMENLIHIEKIDNHKKKRDYEEIKDFSFAVNSSGPDVVKLL